MKTYHDGLAVPSQCILQELGEHRVPVRYLHLHRNKLRIDHVPICELVENSVCTYIHRNYICFELQYLHTALVITVDAYSPCTYVKIILVQSPYIYVNNSFVLLVRTMVQVRIYYLVSAEIYHQRKKTE